MRTRIAFFLMSFALLASTCGNAAQQDAVIQINMNAKYPEKEICLQDIAEISFVPL